MSDDSKYNLSLSFIYKDIQSTVILINEYSSIMEEFELKQDQKEFVSNIQNSLEKIKQEIKQEEPVGAHHE